MKRFVEIFIEANLHPQPQHQSAQNQFQCHTCQPHNLQGNISTHIEHVQIDEIKDLRKAFEISFKYNIQKF